MLSLKDRLSEILTNSKLITRSQLEQALKTQAQGGGNLSDILVDLGFLKHQQLAACLNSELQASVVELKYFDIDPNVAKIIPVNIARRYQAIPLSKSAGSVCLAISDPLNIFAVEKLPELRGLKIEPVIAPLKDISAAIDFCYPAAFEVNMGDFFKESDSPVETVRPEKELFLNVRELERISRDPLAVKTVTLLLEEIVRKKYSGALIEPFGGKLRVRFRSGGQFKEQDFLPRDMHEPVIGRLKAIAGLDISKRLLPQERRFQAEILGHRVDFRICLLPASCGEKAVLRLLDKERPDLGIKDLGLNVQSAKVLDNVLRLNHGIILVCGPAASGKTTTLYAILKSLNTPDKNIITIEDPVEFQIDGINQVSVSPDVGLSFSAGMRSVLLQDPNVIMVGDLRDYETLNGAVKGALGGRLVIASLEAASVADGISRLVEMGIEPYLVKSALVCVIAQIRLRKVCPRCREAYTLNRKAAASLKIDTSRSPKPQFYRAKGCRDCLSTGYSGNVLAVEATRLSHRMQELIAAGSGTEVIRRQAVLEGMYSLRKAGMDAALAGLTTIEEVLRLTPTEV